MSIQINKVCPGQNMCVKIFKISFKDLSKNLSLTWLFTNFLCVMELSCSVWCRSFLVPCYVCVVFRVVEPPLRFVV
jgi:hypothetical protein